MRDIKVPRGPIKHSYWNLGNHFLRFDEAQVLDEGQKGQARSNLGAIGNLRGVVYITTSGTYAPDPEVKAIRVRGCGGGGGSGGVDGTGVSGARAISCGGSGGAYFEFYVPEEDLAASYTCTIGAGGSRGLAASPESNPGGDGGTTIFTDGTKHATAEGGRGGQGMQATTGSASAGPINPAIPLATLLGFSGLAFAGQMASNSYVADGRTVTPSNPGSSPLGVAGPGMTQVNEGIWGTGYGAGGGIAAVGSGDAANFYGAGGTQGVIIIEEFT